MWTLVTHHNSLNGLMKQFLLKTLQVKEDGLVMLRCPVPHK